ncbi:VOC family protein [Paracoccus sp. (in: a-proteobacteria)]|uniref:VOC family protein n=1 Tax=Paracoccus sp. TaxID=267 RepID=UPI003A84AB58
MSDHHGNPCWYELSTAKGGLAAAGAFYARLLGWQIADAGMEGFTYHLAGGDGGMVAGLMETPEDVAGMPPFWMIYFAVTDADRAVADIRAAGGTIHRDVQPIPGTGRFAIAADPQGAAFGILEPSQTDAAGGAFDQSRTGHGNWHELMSTDPVAGLKFYSGLFGWGKSTSMDMGEMGTYQLFSRNGADIGGIMGLGNAPVSCWLPYFGINGVAGAVARIAELGGIVIHGPQEVPGGAFIAVARDPQGAHFAVVGPKDAA